jgi:hypothetical protein
MLNNSIIVQKYGGACLETPARELASRDYPVLEVVRHRAFSEGKDSAHHRSVSGKQSRARGSRNLMAHAIRS